MTDRSFPESHVFGHHARCRERGEDESAGAIAKPSFQQIHAHELRRRLDEYGSRCAPTASGVILLRPPAAVSDELLKILIERSICVMEKRILQLAHLRPFRDIDLLVHLVRVVTEIAPEQTNWFVLSASPAAVADLLSQEIVAPGNPERLTVRRANNLPNLLRQLRRTSLVGVEDENPRRLRSHDPLIPRQSDRREWRADHRRAGGLRQGHRIVERIVLDDYHLTRPLDARDTRFDGRGFGVRP